MFPQPPEAINLLQHFQKEFFLNNNVEDYNPYFIFHEQYLNDIIKIKIYGIFKYYLIRKKKYLIFQ